VARVAVDRASDVAKMHLVIVMMSMNTVANEEVTMPAHKRANKVECILVLVDCFEFRVSGRAAICKGSNTKLNHQ
jgi:hypothetical protein